MEFIPALQAPDDQEGEALWFAFQNNKMLMEVSEGSVSVPQFFNADGLGVTPIRTQYLGRLDGIDCYSAELPSTIDQFPENRSLYSFFDLFGLLKEPLYRIAIYAHQITIWDRDHQYCGKCGSRMEPQSGERAKACLECGHICFPRLSPAIMVGIIKGDSLLLAANKAFPKGFHSILAGFVEPGETLEECVEREVKEEVGLEIENIRYFKSQPWVLSNSLMIAYIADYAGGEIQVDGEEITSAAWYTAESLPHCPDGNFSLAGKVIDWFRRGGVSSDDG